MDWVGTDLFANSPNFSGLWRFYRDRRWRRKPFMLGEWALWGPGGSGVRAAPVRLDPRAPPDADGDLQPRAPTTTGTEPALIPAQRPNASPSAAQSALERLSAGAAREASPAPAPEGAAATARRNAAARGVKPSAEAAATGAPAVPPSAAHAAHLRARPYPGAPGGASEPRARQRVLKCRAPLPPGRAPARAPCAAPTSTTAPGRSPPSRRRHRRTPTRVPAW